MIILRLQQNLGWQLRAVATLLATGDRGIEVPVRDCGAEGHLWRRASCEFRSGSRRAVWHRFRAVERMSYGVISWLHGAAGVFKGFRNPLGRIILALRIAVVRRVK